VRGLSSMNAAPVSRAADAAAASRAHFILGLGPLFAVHGLSSADSTAPLLTGGMLSNCWLDKAVPDTEGLPGDTMMVSGVHVMLPKPTISGSSSFGLLESATSPAPLTSSLVDGKTAAFSEVSLAAVCWVPGQGVRPEII
jgi:hypothetical protein